MARSKQTARKSVGGPIRYSGMTARKSSHPYPLPPAHEAMGQYVRVDICGWVCLYMYVCNGVGVCVWMSE